MYHERMVFSLQVVLTGKRFSAKVCSANGPRSADPVARIALTCSWDISPEQRLLWRDFQGGKDRSDIGFFIILKEEFRGQLLPGTVGGQANTGAFIPRPTTGALRVVTYSGLFKEEPPLRSISIKYPRVAPASNTFRSRVLSANSRYNGGRKEGINPFRRVPLLILAIPRGIRPLCSSTSINFLDLFP